MPYGPKFHVQKIESRNHLLRNYGTKLSLLTKNIKFPHLNLRKHIQSNIIRFRTAIVKSIEYRSKLINQSDNDKRLGILNFFIVYKGLTCMNIFEKLFFLKIKRKNM